MSPNAASASREQSHQHSRMHGEDRRRQLIEVAVDLFSRKGFSGTTTKEIAAAAGVTEAIIFRHFATKQHLYDAIIDYKLHSLQNPECNQEARACMERNDDEGLVRLIAKSIVAAHRADPKFERLMLYAGLEGHELATLYHTRLMPLVEIYRDYFERRQREGAIRPMHPDLMLFAIVSMLKQYSMVTHIFGFHRKDFSDDRAIEQFVAILMHGLKAESR